MKGQDNLSVIFEKVAANGAKAVREWKEAGNVASEAFAEAKSGANVAASAMENAASEAKGLTQAVGENRQEFEDMGVAASEAFEQATLGANTAAEAAKDALLANEDMADTFKSAKEEAESFKQATNQLEKNLRDLEQTYIGTALQKGKNSEEARALQREIAGVSEELRKNKDEWDDLSKSSGAAGVESVDAITQIKTTLATAGIAVLVRQIKGAVIDMGNEFSRAESKIIRATGASGAELSALRENMLNVHAIARNGDLVATAAAVSEVNTRFRIQGTELERVTSKFMDYADMNNTHVAGAIRTVSQLMTRWKIDVSQTESVLDRLTLASQMSGKAVDSLAYSKLRYQSVLEALNFDMYESIALFAALEAGGINASSVMYGLRRSVIYLTRDGGDARDGLMELIDEIKNMDTAAAATSLAVEMFGVRAGPDMANAIRAGKLEIDEWIEAIAGADGTLAATAAAATSLEERWNQASNSMNSAFTRVLGPSVERTSGFFADLKMGAAQFLNDHPAVTAALSGLVATLALATTGVTVFTFAKTVAIPKIKAFGVAVQAAMGPIGWKMIAITALVGVMGGLATQVGRSNDEFTSLTATSRVHYEEVRRLSREYERTIGIYGENSAAARQMRGELEGAQLVFESNRRTREEVRAETERLIGNIDRETASHREVIASINDQENSMTALIGLYKELSVAEELTAGQEDLRAETMRRIADGMGHVGVRIDEVTNSLNIYGTSLAGIAVAEANNARFNENLDRKVELYSQLPNLIAAVEQAEIDYAAARDDLEANPIVFDTTRRDVRDEARQTLRELQAVLGDARIEIYELDQELNDFGADLSGFDAVERAIDSVSGEMLALIERYGALRDTALESIQSQYSIWDRAAQVSTISTQTIRDNLQSQIDQWNTYSENMSTVSERFGHLDGFEVLAQQFGDGSVQAQGAIAGLVNACEGMVVEIIDMLQNRLPESQESAAESFAEMASQFDKTVEEILGSAREFMDDLLTEVNATDDARVAAEETMNAYVAAVRASIGDARDAGRSVASALAGALQGPSGFGVSVSVPRGFAVGTDFAPPGLAWVGEEGPELVNFRGGERVYTHPESMRIITESAPETNRILSVANPVDTSDIKTPEFPVPATGGGLLREERTIKLDITGYGQIELTGEGGAEAAWDYIEPKLKPAVIGMLHEEIFEEGDDSYEF